jgi:uncharacterized membrane protein
MTTTSSARASLGRLHHIDSLRAYAILMMLQGHFIDMLIDPAYRVGGHPLYETWLFCKGFTAPIFFTVTGLVLIYLIFRKEDTEYRDDKIRKAFKRGLYLIFWGYLLRANFFGMMAGQIYREFWKIDVLHCIGIGMLTLSGLYWLCKKMPPAVFKASLLFSSIVIFLLEPIYMSFNYEGLPLGISNYLTRENGSIFTPFPWVGYTLIGGFLGLVYVKNIHRQFGGLKILPIVLATLGFFLMQKSSWLFMQFHHASDLMVFKQVAYNNYLFIRLGHVLLFISGFIVLEKMLSRLNLFNEIGRSTLNIYILHFIVLYGSWFGLGLSTFFAKSLTPLNAILGALLFIIGISVAALNVDSVKGWLNEQKLIVAISRIKKELNLSLKAALLGWSKKSVARKNS